MKFLSFSHSLAQVKLTCFEPKILLNKLNQMCLIQKHKYLLNKFSCSKWVKSTALQKNDGMLANINYILKI